MIVSLPWPDKRLSPNARQHWAAVAKVKKLAREDARLLTRGAIAKHGVATFEGEDRIPVRITFYPPDRRRRDDDNMVGSFKAYRDGIADALGVDDRRFRPHYFFEDAEKPGRIDVEIGA
ncbi:MAG TPA: endodeoxyribonuclease RusA [Erythrobacter sp.]|nr:endodeoxyribonuclease RusA [Erythrobacter sp.]